MCVDGALHFTVAEKRRVRLQVWSSAYTGLLVFQDFYYKAADDVAFCTSRSGLQSEVRLK
jgi:hypothetical protein